MQTSASTCAPHQGLAAASPKRRCMQCGMQVHTQGLAMVQACLGRQPIRLSALDTTSSAEHLEDQAFYAQFGNPASASHQCWQPKISCFRPLIMSCHTPSASSDVLRTQWSPLAANKMHVMQVSSGLVHVLLLLILGHAHCILRCWALAQHAMCMTQYQEQQNMEVVGSMSVQLLAGHGIEDLNLRV